MAEAYLVGGDFDTAKLLYGRVVELGTAHVGEADAAWKKIDRMQRAGVGTPEGDSIAQQEAIDRADVAALFIRDLELEKVFSRLGPGGAEHGAMPPARRRPITPATS